MADEEKLVAIKEGDQNYEQFLEDYYPNWRMIRYSGDEACFRAVVSGEVDYTPLCNYRIAKMEPLLEKYKVITVTTGQEASDRRWTWRM